jgi:hypothetical protein
MNIHFDRLRISLFKKLIWLRNLDCAMASVVVWIKQFGFSATSRPERQTNPPGQRNFYGDGRGFGVC